MNSPIEPTTLTSAHLATARLAPWHQNGEALLTFENMRSWLNAAGLVLFTPRAQQLPSPAPSMVEAFLGAPNPTPSLAEIEQTRSILSRLIAEGAAVPLNLLGTPSNTGTETPDFVVSSAIFPYIFTLRGDKAWKQPPATTGATRVSPLALNTYTLLSEKITLSAYDLVTQLGKEVTEAAVLRALTELWTHLRVLPIPQPDGAPTLWELTSSRFTKPMKAGANAGQPSALSALVSLYLGQALVATEDEIETFLSPLAPRSRIRDVVHALLAARELQTVVIEGRTLLHVSGAAPAFLSETLAATPAAEAEAGETTEAEGSSLQETDGSRIKKFVPRPKKIGTGFVAKPVRTYGSSSPDRERRPFVRKETAARSSASRPAASSYAKPWEEDKAARAAADQGEASSAGDAASRPSRPERKPYDAASRSDRPRPSFPSRPSSGPRRDDDRGGDSRGPRKTFSKPGTFARKREGFAARPAFDRDSAARPPRREFSDSRPPRKDFGDSRPPRRDFGDSRPPRKDFGDARPPRREYTGSSDRPARPYNTDGRPSSDRPAFGKPRSARGDAFRPEGKPGGYQGKSDFAPRKSFGAGKPGFSRDRDAAAGSDSRPARPVYRKFDAPRGDRPSRPFSSDRPPSNRPPRAEGAAPYGDKPRRTFSDRPSRPSAGTFDRPRGKSTGFAGKKPFTRSASSGPGADRGKPASTFDKFKGNKKPFGKRAPSRKFKPEEGETA